MTLPAILAHPDSAQLAHERVQREKEYGKICYEPTVTKMVR
jgi:hypothetical protein